jgi:hypothetical protein
MTAPCVIKIIGAWLALAFLFALVGTLPFMW